MSDEKQVPKLPVFFVRPKPGKSAASMGDEVADGLIVQINVERRAHGLPPLEVDDET